MKNKVHVFLLYVFITFFSCLQFPIKTYAETPKWRILWIILPKVNAAYNGVLYNYSLTPDEIAVIRAMSKRAENFFEAASGNAVDFEITIMESTGTITKLTEVAMSNSENGTFETVLDVDENDLPSDVKEKITMADDNSRPYHLKVANFKLAEVNEANLPWHGLTSGNYSRVRFLGNSYYEASELNPHPEETWVHEMLHAFEWLFDGLGTIPSNHDGWKYGYGKQNDSIWWEYYRDIIGGNVRDPSTGNLIGIKPYMWAHIPQGHVKVWNGHTYKIHDLSTTWPEAETYCESLGGHLVTITTDEEQNMLLEMLGDMCVQNDSAEWYWLGASKVYWAWQWATNEAWSYENFYFDWGGVELQMYSAKYGEHAGQWFSNVDLYNQPHGFICEWDSEQVFNNNYTDDTNTDYIYHEPTGNTDNSSVKNTGSSSGGGCNSSFGGAAFLIAGAFTILKRLK